MNDTIKSQLDYQKMLYTDLSALDEATKISKSNTMILAIIEELGELMSEYKAFDWKKDKVVNKDTIQEELIDIYHFFANLCIIWGISSDEQFKKVYFKKLLKNYERGKTHVNPSHHH